MDTHDEQGEMDKTRKKGQGRIDDSTVPLSHGEEQRDPYVLDGTSDLDREQR